MSSVPQKSPRSAFLKMSVAAAAALGVMWLLLSAHRTPDAGAPLPPIQAVGWLNGPAPKPGEFDGKVLVVDAWASWCAPCREQAPELVQLYNKYHDHGVEFIGLSNEPAEALPNMERYLEYTGIKWKNG